MVASGAWNVRVIGRSLTAGPASGTLTPAAVPAVASVMYIEGVTIMALAVARARDLVFSSLSAGFAALSIAGCFCGHDDDHDGGYDDGYGGYGGTGEGEGGGGDCANTCDSPEVLISGLPTLANVATDGTTLFFSSGGHTGQLYFDGKLFSIPNTGAAVATALAGDFAGVEAVAVDGDHILFSSVGTQAGDALDGFIGRIPKIGGGVEQVATSQPVCTQIVVHEGSYFWSTSGNWSGNWANGTIKRATPGSSVLTTIVEPEVKPDRFAIDGAYMYWASSGSAAADYLDGAVRRTLIEGGPIETLASDLELVTAVAVANGQVYFGTKEAVHVLDPAVPGQSTVFATLVDKVSNFVVDGDSLYWTEGGSDGRVVRAPLAGGDVQVLADHITVPFGLATDAQYVYFTERGTGVDDGAIYRVAKSSCCTPTP